MLALATAAALGACRRSAADIRYAIACLGLAAMLATAAATAVRGTLPGHAAFLSADQLSPAGRLGTPIEASIGAEGTLPSAASQAVRTASSSQLLSIVVWIWLAGVTSLVARLAAGCWRVHRLRAATIAAPLSSWQSTAGRLARRLRVGVPFRIVESAVVDAPILIGWLQPLIMLPLAAMARMTAAGSKRSSLTSSPRVRRRDYAMDLLRTIAEALFSSVLPSDGSRGASARSASPVATTPPSLPGEATTYAEALLALASWRERDFQPSLGRHESSLVLRIRRLLSVAPVDEPPRFAADSSCSDGCLLAATVMVLSAVSSATAQTPRARTTRPLVRQTDHVEICCPPVARSARRSDGPRGGTRLGRVSLDLRHNLGGQECSSSSSGRPPSCERRLSEPGTANVRGTPAIVEDRILFHVDVPAGR